MKKILKCSSVVLFAAVLASGCAPVLESVPPPQPPPADSDIFASRGSFQKLIDETLVALHADDKLYSRGGFPSKELVLRSLVRFRDLLIEAKDAQEFEQSLRREFVFYRGGDAEPGKVFFTGYYQPLLKGSRTRTEIYKYPLFSPPLRLPDPSPKRRELEEGKLRGNLLKGRELVYLADPLDAFLAQVQGSAAVELEQGGVITLAFAGATQHPYVSIGSELIRDGKLKAGEAGVPQIKSYFKAHPEELQDYLWRNDRFVFFRVANNSGAKGALGVTLLAQRSIATDKRIYPPGAIALYETTVPRRFQDGQAKGGEGWRAETVRRFSLDLDTGSAIAGPKRVDIYFGEGNEAGETAGRMQSRGNLYYVLLKQ